MADPLADLAAVAAALETRAAVYRPVCESSATGPVVVARIYRGTWHPPAHRRPTDPIYALVRSHKETLK